MNTVENPITGMDLIRKTSPYIPTFEDRPSEELPHEQSLRLKSATWGLAYPHVLFIIGPLEEQLDHRVNGIPHFLPAGTFVAEIGLGEGHTKTTTMWDALQGVVLFLDKLDALEDEMPDLPIPKFMYGATNLQVATLATRFGFTILDNVDKGGHNGEIYEIFGFVRNIHEKIVSFAEKSRIQRLIDRVNTEDDRKFEKGYAALNDVFPTLEFLQAQMSADL